MARPIKWSGVPAGSKIKIEIIGVGNVQFGATVIYDSPGPEDEITWTDLSKTKTLEEGRTAIIASIAFQNEGSVKVRATLERNDGQQHPGSPAERTVSGDDNLETVYIRIDCV